MVLSELSFLYTLFRHFDSGSSIQAFYLNWWLATFILALIFYAHCGLLSQRGIQYMVCVGDFRIRYKTRAFGLTVTSQAGRLRPCYSFLLFTFHKKDCHYKGLHFYSFISITCALSLFSILSPSPATQLQTLTLNQ